MQRLRLRQEASEDDTGADTMAGVEDGTAFATEEDAAATPEADDGTAHASEEGAAASADLEAAEDEAGTDSDSGGRRRHRGCHRRRMQRPRLRQSATEDEAGTDTMAEADDGTAGATTGGCSGYA